MSSPSNPVATPHANNQMTVEEQNVRIKVKISYALSGDKPSDIPDKAWDNWKNSIDEQKEEFFLSLLKHEFSFLGMQGVELSADFIATGNAKALQPSYDIFGGLDMARWTKVREAVFRSDQAARESHRQAIVDFTNDVAIVRREIELREAVIATRIQLLGSDSNPADTVFVAAEIAAGRATSTLVQLRARLEEKKDLLSDLESKISRCENKIEDIVEREEQDVLNSRQQRARFKIRLLEQLDFNGGNALARFAARKRIHRAKANKVISPISNIEIFLGAHNLSGGGSNYEVAVGEEQLETLSEFNDNLYTEGGFVFIGDIIEAAYESISLQNQQEEGSLSPTAQAVLDAAAALEDLPEIRLTSDNAAAVLQRRQERIVAERALSVAENNNYYNSGYERLPPFCLQSEDDFSKNIESLDFVFTGLVKYPNPARANDEMLAVNIRDIPISYDLFRNWFHGKASEMKSYPLRDFIPDLMLFVTEMFKKLSYRQSITPVEIEDSKFPRFAVNNVLYNSVSIPEQINSQKKHLYTPFNSVETTLQETKRSPNGRYVTVAEQSNVSDMPSDNVPNIIFGQADRGILKQVSFEREDIPGHAEARLMTDRQSVSSNIALREKYNVSLDMRGTTSFLPGSVLYLDITPIELGYTDEDNSYSKQLGLGGMYRVVSVQSSIDLEGAGNKWTTRLKTKWESFGDGTNGDPAQIVSDELSGTEPCL